MVTLELGVILHAIEALEVDSADGAVDRLLRDRQLELLRCLPAFLIAQIHLDRLRPDRCRNARNLTGFGVQTQPGRKRTLPGAERNGSVAAIDLDLRVVLHANVCLHQFIARHFGHSRHGQHEFILCFRHVLLRRIKVADADFHLRLSCSPGPA